MSLRQSPDAGPSRPSGLPSAYAEALWSPASPAAGVEQIHGLPYLSFGAASVRYLYTLFGQNRKRRCDRNLYRNFGQDRLILGKSSLTLSCSGFERSSSIDQLRESASVAEDEFERDLVRVGWRRLSWRQVGPRMALDRPRVRSINRTAFEMTRLR